MADEKEVAAGKESPPEAKKKGKLPLIIIAVLVVIGAVIGVMKSGKSTSASPPLELGEIESLGPEFLANLADGRSYIRTNISVQLSKTLKAEEFKKMLPTVRDAVILCLSSKGIDEMNRLEGKENLKREIAYYINDVLEAVEGKKPHEKKVDHSAAEASPKGDSSTHSPVVEGAPQDKQKTVDISSPDKLLARSSSAKVSDQQPKNDSSVSDAKPWNSPKSQRKFPDWDSDTGPVLMVYFTDFATQ